MKDKFEVKHFAANSLDLNRSVIGRIRNQFVKALSEEILLPRVVVILQDNDIINSVKPKAKKSQVSEIYGRITHWLADKLDKAVAEHVDYLPNKAIKEGYPTFLWIAPPQHRNFRDNQLRQKMTTSIKSAIGMQKSHTMLTMKKIWDYQDGSLYYHDRFITEGFETFWKSIDSALNFWYTHLAQKNYDSSAKYHIDNFPVNQQDRFHLNPPQQNKFFNKFHRGAGFRRNNKFY